MKFKYKVLIANIIVLSVSLGFTGYLMIRKNFNLALNSLVINAIVENNFAQSSIEYDLLEVLNSSNANLNNELTEIGKRMDNNLISSNTALFIHYDDKILFDEFNQQESIPDSILEFSTIGAKTYIIDTQTDGHYIYVASCNRVKDSLLQIITKRSIEEAYELMIEQINFFMIILILVLFLGSILIYILSSFLTKPLERLNEVSDEMAGGNYKMRVSVKSDDEIGQLALKFNHMATSVDNHVDELQQQIKRREQFVADFTHEIKTPMTTIIGYAETMRSIELPRIDQITYLNYIFSAGKRLEIMSQKLFELIYLNRHDIETNPVNTKFFIKEIEEFSLPILSKKDIKLECDVENAVILANKDLLETAFINFIDNARKASEEHTTILLSGKREKEAYVFSVKDEGIGISKENLHKICDEFYMVDKSRSRKEGSAGLGLSLASLIVKCHGATLNIESKEGAGTTIFVIFPKDTIVEADNTNEVLL